MILDFVLEFLLINMAIEREKGDFVKLSILCKRNSHFARSWACFRRSKSIKKRLREQNDF